MTLNIDLSNYRALVTGVSSGIGAGIAEVLAKAGCDIAGCGVEPASSEGTKRFIASVQNHRRRAFYQSVDPADGGTPYFNMGLEPCIGAQDSLSEAVSKYDLFAKLPPHGRRTWWLEIELLA